jgi:hypothetical protein
MHVMGYGMMVLWEVSWGAMQWHDLGYRYT